MSYFSHTQFGVLGAIKAAASTFLSQAEASIQVSPPSNLVGLACWVYSGYFFPLMLILFLILLIPGSSSLVTHCSGLLCPRWLPCRNLWALPSGTLWPPAASLSWCCAPREERLHPSRRTVGSTSPTSRSPTSSTTPSLWLRRYSSQSFSFASYLLGT